MRKTTFILRILLINLISLPLIAQNQLPIVNGQFEDVASNSFTQWTHQSNNGGNANYSIETNDLITGSTKALKSEIIALGTNGYDVLSKNDYAFQVVAGGKYTVSFYAKTEGATTSDLRLVFQSEVSGSFQSKNITITNNWQRYTHTFTATTSANSNQVKFWYLQTGVTYFLDEVAVVPGNYLSLDTSETFQTIEGFGGGIKRQTNNLFALDPAIRQQVEAYCFQDLEPNMIRFFVYHHLEEGGNDNNDPFVLDETQLDWRRYESDPSTTQSHYVAEALNNAFSLSANGFDEVIGNSNTGPSWMKKNESFKRLSANEDVLLNTLKDGMEDEFSEFLVAFLKGMKSRYNIDVTAISPTNEPDYLNTYESMNLTPSELTGVIKNLNTRLDTENLGSVKIVSPENGTLAPQSNNQLTTINSATDYMNIIFQDTEAQSAVDVVGTHTYFDSSHDANWANLKTASMGKPLWVTESANLNDSDISMTDAGNYVKWMIRGFNEGGLTAYMTHFFYQKRKENGDSSALVVWTDTGEIILPKRYYTYKHFSKLIKKGYKRMGNQFVLGNGIMVSSFISPENDKVVVQVFNEGAAQDISIDAPIGTTSVTHYSTSDDSNTNFSELNDISYNLGDRYVTFNVPTRSLHSIVYEIGEVAPLDTEAPSAVAALTSSNITTNAFDVTWSASTDNVAVTGYDIYVDDVLHGSTSNTSYTISNLSYGTTYSTSVIAVDAAGNQSTESVIDVTTILATNSIISVTGPNSVNIGSTVNVSLDYSSSATNDIVLIFQRDNSPNTTYGNVRTTVNAGTGTLNVSLLIQETVPVAADDYQYQVYIAPVGGVWADRFDNLNQKDVSAVSTSTDTEAPSMVSALASSNITTSSFNLSWSPSTDNVAVTAYNVFVNGDLDGTTSSNTSYPITGLSSGTTYSISVVALDAVGNESTLTVINVSTSPGTNHSLKSLADAKGKYIGNLMRDGFFDDHQVFNGATDLIAKTEYNTLVAGNKMKMSNLLKIRPVDPFNVQISDITPPI